ncbi:hypothetical protein [Pedobacter immunditicola]|uniref:hypothetical protein n=1 Tax=Pedobacter immunditicola TaxID=3133440 RepID=UPI0030A599F6
MSAIPGSGLSLACYPISGTRSVAGPVEVDVGRAWFLGLPFADLKDKATFL